MDKIRQPEQHTEQTSETNFNALRDAVGRSADQVQSFVGKAGDYAQIGKDAVTSLANAATDAVTGAGSKFLDRARGIWNDAVRDVREVQAIATWNEAYGKFMNGALSEIPLDKIGQAHTKLVDSTKQLRPDIRTRASPIAIEEITDGIKRRLDQIELWAKLPTSETVRPSGEAVAAAPPDIAERVDRVNRHIKWDIDGHDRPHHFPGNEKLLQGLAAEIEKTPVVQALRPREGSEHAAVVSALEHVQIGSPIELRCTDPTSQPYAEGALQVLADYTRRGHQVTIEAQAEPSHPETPLQSMPLTAIRRAGSDHVSYNLGRGNGQGISGDFIKIASSVWHQEDNDFVLRATIHPKIEGL